MKAQTRTKNLMGKLKRKVAEGWPVMALSWAQ